MRVEAGNAASSGGLEFTSMLHNNIARKVAVR